MNDFRHADKDPDLTPTRLRPSRRGDSTEPRLSPHRSPPRIDPKVVPGWGADLDPSDRPAVPMERTPPRLDGLHWADPPPAQRTDVEILVSSERPTLTPVYGSSVPPRGVSGWIRRRAFRHSENNLRHWLMLLLADRIDVVEGLFGGSRRH